MFTFAQWVTDNPIVIPFIIAGLAFVTFKIYMAIWGCFERAVGFIVSIIVNAIKYVIVKIKNTNWVSVSITNRR